MGKQKEDEEQERQSESEEENTSSSEESEQAQWQVEVITKARVSEDCGWDYYVKWYGFDSDEDSWEPNKNVESCDRLLSSFWHHIGIDDFDYPVGHIVEAKPEWIAKEKRWFRKNFDSFAKKKQSSDKIAFTTKGPSSSSNIHKKDHDKREQSRQRERDSRGKKASKRPTLVDTESDDSDQPLLKIRKTSMQSPRRRSLTKRDVSGGPPGSSAGALADKGKGKERALASTPPPPFGSSHSLFSAPSSPAAPLGQHLPPSPTAKRPQDAATPLTGVKPNVNETQPSHWERKIKPKVKLLDMPAPNTGQGIPIKQRLSMGSASSSLTPTTTNVPQLPNVAAQRSALSKLSFTKNKVPSGDRQFPVSPKVATPNTSNLAKRNSIITEADLTQSPVAMTHDDFMQVDHDDGGFAEPPPPPPQSRPLLPLPRASTGSLPKITPSLEDEVNKFLQSMPSELYAPMYENPATNESRPAASTTARSTRMPKKWTWEGELYVETAEYAQRHVCNIMFTDVSDPRPLGLQFKIIFPKDAKVESIRLQKLHDASDIPFFVSACTPVQQFCRIAPQAEGDKDALKTLAMYMHKRRQFSYSIVNLDDECIGFLIVFPSTLSDIRALLNPPLEFQQSSQLVVGLCPWTLNNSELKQHSWLPEKQPSPLPMKLLPPAYSSVMKHSGKLANSLMFNRALRILKFPKPLYDFMSQQNRPYCVWNGSPSTPHDIETLSLKAILDACGARNAGLKSDVRAMFIHVGALPTLYKVQSMWARRSKRPEVRFFTYGTHERVPPERWGTLEVFPIGGVVTFSMAAILEDPTGVCRLIEQAESHPLWTCFIPPVIIGGVAKVTCKDSDPLTLFDRDECFCAPLLSLIEGGKISLVTSPPQTRHPKRDEENQTGYTDPAKVWVSGQLSLLSMKARDILEACMYSFEALHAKLPASQIPAAVGKDALREIDAMQFQPAIMDEYRRYVVIKGTTETLQDKRDLLEITTLSTFDFKDDFFLDGKKAK